MSKLKKITVFLITSFMLLLIGIYATVTAVNCEIGQQEFTIKYGEEGINHEYHGIFKEHNKYSIFCAERGGSLKGSSQGNPIYYYKKDGIQHKYDSYNDLKKWRRLAYLIGTEMSKENPDTNAVQDYIWKSNLNEGVDIELDDEEQEEWEGAPIKKYEAPSVSVDISNAKCKTEDGNIIIGPIKINYSGGIKKDNNRNLTVAVQKNDGTMIDGWVRNDGQPLNKVTSGEEAYFKCEKSKLEGIKEIKVYAKYDVYNYWFEYQKYKGTGYVNGQALQGEDEDGQELIGVKGGKNQAEAHDTSRVIKLDSPRLITTKYISSIQHSNEDTWNANTQPSVTVDTSKEVMANDRYNLTKQNTSNINLAFGDIVTYKIRVYNVGDGDANLESDESDKQTMADENERKIISEGKVYDYYSSNLEIVEDNPNIWYKNDTIRVMYADVEDAFGSTTIKACESGNPSFIETSIKFKVNGGINATKIDIKNNDSEIRRDDSTHLKFLYERTTKDAKGNQITEKLTEPSVSVNTGVPVGDKNRFTYNLNASNPTIMNGDTLKYCIRCYSIGENSTVINYNLKDEFGNNYGFGSGIRYDSAENALVINNNDNNTLTILPNLNKTLNGYTGGEIDYYDIYLNFTVEFDSSKISYIENKIKGEPGGPGGPEDPPPSRQRTGYEIKGKVFKDEKTQGPGKTLDAGDALLNNNENKKVQGVKVELLHTDGSNVADEWSDDGIPYIKDEGLKYPTTVYTNEEGEYTFTHLPAREIKINSNGEIEGDLDISTPYRIRFTYNGQEYENVKYNEDMYAGNGSYATEGNNNRENFNDKFTTIDSTNSENYTLKKDEYKDIAEGKGPDRAYNISSYTGSAGWESTDGIINVDTAYKHNVNLGLIQRNFNLSLENSLDSMDISINGVKQTLYNFGRRNRRNNSRARCIF